MCYNYTIKTRRKNNGNRSNIIIGCLMQDSDHPDRESVMEYLKQCQVDLIENAYDHGDELEIISVEAKSVEEEGK